MSYTVRVGFDEAEHRYYVLDSDIPGLHVETATFEEFIEVTKDFAPDLIGDRAERSENRVQARSRSHLMGGNLYPELIRLLRSDGCEFVRSGKGSHELWRSPRTNKLLVIPRDTVKRHTANSILRDAGLPKAF